MGKYISKRLIISVFTLLVILFVLFFMLDKMPGSPFNDEKLTAEQFALLNQKYGLDQPFIIRFFNYVKCVLHGDFGLSYSINKDFSVTKMLVPRLSVSIIIGIQATLLGTFIGLILGIIGALNRNTWIDNLTTGLSVLGVSVPSYVFALGLAYFVGYKLRLFPILYNVDHPFSSTVLPTIALSMFTIANIARFTRSEMIEVMGTDYVLLAQAKGIKQWKLIIRHVLRNTLIAIITVMGPLLVGLLTGSMVIERIFGIPGIGSLMIQGIQSNDYNVVMACAFTYSFLYIIVMLIVDILYGVIDPRIRVTKGVS